MSKIIEITLVIAVITVAEAIQCNFVYKESDVVTPNTGIIWPNDPNRFKPPTKKYEETEFVPFECDDPSLDDFIPISVGNVSVNNRNTEEDDDYVLEEMCHSTKMTIEPKELNNINNQLRKIAVVQSITIEKCVNPKKSCSSDVVPANKKVICIQKHLIVKLKVRDDSNKLIVEPLYYPSACVCATFMKKSDS